jgi:hypothetical protein
MSLDISKLQNVRIRGNKTTARCPACAESGRDKKGEHLIIHSPRGHFGCVVYPGNGPDAKGHRRRIFALCGDRKIKALVIRRVTGTGSLGRSGRPLQSHSEVAPIKTGLLGRLGRVFETHAQRDPEIEASAFPVAGQRDIRGGVPAVLNPQLRLNRALTERELSILRRAGAENDPIIITALNLFNATIVE